MASELVRSDKDDRLRSIITTDAVYFVKAKGPPSAESVVLCLEYSELYIAKVVVDSSAPIPGQSNSGHQSAYFPFTLHDLTVYFLLSYI